MRILFTLNPAFDPNAGGVQQTTNKLGKYFSDSGLDVYYYSMAISGHKTPKYGRLFVAPEVGESKNLANTADLKNVITEIKPNVVINQMPYDAGLRNTIAELRSELNYLLLGCLRNSLFNFKSNVQDKMSQYLPRPLFLLFNNPLGIRIILSWHKQKHSRNLRAIIDQHDYFILLAPPNLNELKYFVGNYKLNKVITIPNSIPKVQPVKSVKGKIILHVGRLNISQKRSDLLLDFWSHLHAQLKDWRFLIVGDGAYYTTLKSELRKRDLPRVELVGFQEPTPYYEKASIFMMPSAYEGFPNTIIEAQSFGCVPLAFNSYGALDWIVNDGEDALLSKPFDTHQMANQAINLARSSDRIIEMQHNSKNNASRFTIDKVGRKWIELFKQNISGKT